MKTFHIYDFLNSLFWERAKIAIKSMLDLYIDDSKNSLINEALTIGEIQINDIAFHNGASHNTQSITFIKDWFSKV